MNGPSPIKPAVWGVIMASLVVGFLCCLDAATDAKILDTVVEHVQHYFWIGGYQLLDPSVPGMGATMVADGRHIVGAGNCVRGVQGGQDAAARASSSSMAFLNRGPPSAEKPPSLPSERTIRWQGMTRGTGLSAMAAPTARAAAGCPTAVASCL